MLRYLVYTISGIVGFLVLGTPSGFAQSIHSSVETNLAYTGEVVAVPAGGLDRGVRYLDNLDVTATVRADSLIGWSGLTAFAYGLGNQGGNPSTMVGDAQVTSNIEAPLSWRLYEAWLQQTLGTRASVLVGLYDLNAEFDVNRTGSLFLNSAHGIGTPFGLSGRNGPSIFPVTSLAARLRVRMARRGYVQAAVLDGVPGDPADPGGTVVRFGEDDGVLVASEAGVYLDGGAPSRTAMVDRTAAVDAPIKLAVGGWAYTTPLRPWPQVNRPGGVPVATRGSAGAYLLAEGRLRREPGTDEQGLSGFVRLGWANDRYNRFSQYVGAGLVFTGPFQGRNADRAGLAVASALNGDAFEAAQRRGGEPVTTAETNIEATYAAPVTPWLTLIGDVQYVVNPNTDPAIPDTLVGGIRVVVEP